MSAIVTLPKLAAVLGMMGSEHDGEVLAAARTAERLRRQLGKNWDDLLLGSPSKGNVGRPAPAARDRPDPHWRDMIVVCRRRPDLLTEWEAAFVASVATQTSISRKQWAILARIAAKARDGGEGV